MFRCNKETTKNKFVMQMHGDMKVPGVVYGNENIMNQLKKRLVLVQI